MGKMKKNWFYILLSMFIVAVPSLTSCDEEDVPQPAEILKHDPESDADQSAVEAYDALEWLQGCLVLVDNKDEVIRRINGKPLDESQPTIISLPVSDLAAAEKTFLGWVAPGKEANEVQDGYDYYLTDAYGNAQGCVSFRVVEEKDGVIARMTVASGTALKQVSEVNFVNTENWPENDAIPVYQEGKLYKFGCCMYTNSPPLTEMPGADIELDDYWTLVNWEERDFYCLQGNDDGKEAILVWLLPEKGGKANTTHFFIRKVERQIDYPIYKALSSLSEAEKVLDFYHAHHDKWQKMLDEMEALGYSWKPAGFFSSGTNNMEFLLNGYDEKENEIKCLDLDKEVGKICNVSCSLWNLFEYRYMHIRIFPPATKKVE